MSIITGLATAPGVSPLLNAPKNTNEHLRAMGGEPTQTAALRRAEPTPPNSRVQSARPVLPGASPETSTTVSRHVSRDPRYLKFMKALEVVRGATGDEELDETRRAEFAEEAPEIFQLFDGTPSPVEPVDNADASTSKVVEGEMKAA